MTDYEATAIKVTVGDLVLHGTLGATPTARDLIAQLPLTLRFRDLNGVEKYAELPRKLSLEGVPAGDDPDPAEIGYYAPGGNLVFYYRDVGYWPGIVRLGAFDTCVEPIADINGEFVATLELAA
jgi:hypothetical protein